MNSKTLIEMMQRVLMNRGMTIRKKTLRKIANRARQMSKEDAIRFISGQLRDIGVPD